MEAALFEFLDRGYYKTHLKQLQAEIDWERLRKRLARRKVIISLSENAFFGQPYLNGFRLGYAMLSQDDMQRGIEIVAGELRQEISRR